MAITEAIPIDAFAGSFVEQGGRQEIMLPDGNGGFQSPAQLSVGVAPFGKRHSDGIQYIIDAACEHQREYVRVGLAHNRALSGPWKKWEQQLEGIPPERADNMISRVTHNVVVEVDRQTQQWIEDSVLRGRFFKYETPGWAAPAEGREIARNIERIAVNQLENTTDFERNRKDWSQAVRFYGYGHAICEFESGIKPAGWNGMWRDQYFSKGTTFQAQWPWYMLWGKWNEPNWQKQPFMGYVHEIDLPMLQSNHIAAMLGQDDQGQEVVYAHGQFFNLDEIEEKTRHQTAQARRIGENEGANQARTSHEVDTSVRRLLAYTFWTREMDVAGIVSNAKQRHPGLTDEEIFLELGLTPNQIENCPLWKITAIDPKGGENYVADPEIVCQILPTPYAHGQIPIVGAQAMRFPDRATGIGIGQTCYYMQHALTTLLTLMVDNQIRNSTDMYVIMKDAFKNPPEEFVHQQGYVFEMKEGSTETDAKKIFQRLDPGLANWNESSMMLDRMYNSMKSVAGAHTPPFSGRTTAYEISQIMESSTRGVQVELGHNMLMALFDFAKMQMINNAQFLREEDAIRIAGSAGLDLEYVQQKHEQYGGAITALPMQIKVVGKKRIVERGQVVQQMIALQNTPLKQMDLQFKAQGVQPPPEIQQELLDIYEMLGIEDAEDKYFPQTERVLKPQEVAQIIREGTWVGIDPTRWRGNLQLAYMELQAVREIARSGHPLAALHVDQLATVIQEMQGAMMQQQRAMGGPQTGQGGAGAAGGGMMPPGPTPMRQMLPNAQTAESFNIRSTIPTEPTPDMVGF